MALPEQQAHERIVSIAEEAGWVVRDTAEGSSALPR